VTWSWHAIHNRYRHLHIPGTQWA